MAEFSHTGYEKKQFVQKMFNDISHKYDFLNHFLSLGLDIYWRKKLIQFLEIKETHLLLDVATGTGDLIFEILKKYPIKIVGLDYAYKMVQIAKQKSESKGFSENTYFIQGDGENLPFKNNTFDNLTISFGFRNIGHYNKALKEFCRVLKPEGQLIILEFSEPKSKIFNYFYQVYFNYILPNIGALFSRADAYRYLPESVSYFPPRKEIFKLMSENGLKNVSINDLTFGVCTIYIGYR